MLPVLITNNHIINEDILYKNDEYINLDIKGEKNVKKINIYRNSYLRKKTI